VTNKSDESRLEIYSKKLSVGNIGIMEYPKDDA